MKPFYRRKRFFLPAAFIASAVVFFVFFFDPLLRWGLEKGATALNGAKVDIAKVRTRFLNPEILISGIEVTDRSEPMRNLVALDRVQLRLVGRQLLERKIVVEKAAILGLRYGTQRRASGAIPGKRPVEESIFYEKWSNELSDRVRALKSEFSFARLESLLGFDPKDLPKLGEDSITYRRLRELSSDIENGSVRWKQQLATLPDDAALARWSAKVESFKKKPASPQEVATQLKALRELQTELGTTLDKAKGVQAALGNEVAGLGKKLASVDEALAQDMRELRGKLKLPSLTLQDISATLFGDDAEKYLRTAMYWIAVAQKYMPAKNDGKSESVAAKPKVETGYPKFVLIRGEISSDVSSDPNQGRFRGVFADFTSNPKRWGKPATLSIEGDLPAREVRGIRLSASFDHTRDVSSDEVQFEVATLPLNRWVLSEGQEVGLVIEKATARTMMKVRLTGDELLAKLEAQFRDIDYASQARNPLLADLLKKTLSDVRAFRAAVTMDGPVASPRLAIESDLGARLAGAIQREFKEKIAALNEKIRKELHGEVDQRKRQVAGLLEEKKNAVLEAVGAKLKWLESTTQLAETVKAQLEKEASSAVKSQVSEKVDAVKKKLNLPRF
jgi:uncharacterized protein (TIGR03545 family)